MTVRPLGLPELTIKPTPERQGVNEAEVALGEFGALGPQPLVATINRHAIPLNAEAVTPAMQPPCGFVHHDEPASDVCGWTQHWAAHGATALSAEDVAVYKRNSPPDTVSLFREQHKFMICDAFEKVIANWGSEYETAFGKSLRVRVRLVFPSDVKLYESAGQ